MTATTARGEHGGGMTGRVRQSFSVGFEYPVVFTRHAFDPRNATVSEVLRRREPRARHRLAVVIDGGVAEAWPGLPTQIAAYARAYAPYLCLAAPPLTIAGGEAAKNDPEVPLRLLAWLHNIGLDRHSSLLIVGGGAVLDAAGFAGATFHRGLRVVRLPTTVLAQDDSGVGVKNGVNAFGVKNLIGTFHPPFGVVNDLAFLETLPPRDRRAGMAEAVKVAAIRDADFFAWLRRNTPALRDFAPEAVAELVRRSAALHLNHIATGGDPFEDGSARPLDFGHWAAHKLESLSRHAVRHGEAVAVGMALDARYSVEAGLLPPEAAETLCALLEDLGFRLWHPALDERDAAGRRQVMAGLEEFRAHLGGELTVTLLEAIGRGVEVHAIDEAAMTRAFAWLQERDAARCA